jgi:hypothetical protein
MSMRNAQVLESLSFQYEVQFLQSVNTSPTVSKLRRETDNQRYLPIEGTTQRSRLHSRASQAGLLTEKRCLR